MHSLIMYLINMLLYFGISSVWCLSDRFGTAELLSQDHSNLSDDRMASFRTKKDLKYPEVQSEFVGDLLKMNTDHLSDDQKVILKRIAERVARFGGGAAFGEEIDNSTISSSNTTAVNDTISETSSESNTELQLDEVTAAEEDDIEEDDLMGRSNLKHGQKIMSISKLRIPTKVNNNNNNMDENNDSSGKYNKIDVNNATGVNFLTNYTEVMLGNISTSSIVDSLSITNIPKDIYAGRRPPVASIDNDKLKKDPPGTAKPTKYHYYPHNQHIYLLPECAIQQVCNAVYVRLNYTQPLCACPARYRDPCSASINEDDLHTTKLIGDSSKGAITLAKTCETTTEMRECRLPRDWSLLALQNTRTGKSHYLVICRCPDHFILEGPMAHDQPTYASVPGIRVFGMMCVKPGVSVRKPVASTLKPELNNYYQPINQTNYHYSYRSDNPRSFSPTTQQDIAVTTVNHLTEISSSNRNHDSVDDDSINTTIEAIKSTLSNL